jgi:hypothetical protein
VKKQYLFLVFTNPVEGAEDAYNSWYNEQHLADVVKVPGYVKAERFKFAPVGGGEPQHRYLAIYTVETDDLEATAAALKARSGTSAMVMSDALDVNNLSTAYFEPLGVAKTAD